MRKKYSMIYSNKTFAFIQFVGTSSKEKNDFVMRIPLHFSRYYEKNTETDGLVPRDSTIFGIYRGDCLNGSVSHSEIIDFMTGKEIKVKVHAFYAALAGELAQMGF